jgi:VCBS repeat-containing protein
LQSTGDVIRLDQTTLALWQRVLGNASSLNIRVAIADLPQGQLAEALITRFDATGLPVDGRITVDVNGDGHGWFIDSTPLDDSEFRNAAPEVTGRYDLFTVLAHEIGHLLGFDRDFVGFDRHVVETASGTFFIGSGVNATLTSDGNHLAGAANPASVMNSTLTIGTRKLPSQLEALILSIARDLNSPAPVVDSSATSSGSSTSSAGSTGTTGQSPSNPTHLFLEAGSLVNGDFGAGNPGGSDFGWTTRGQVAVNNGQVVLTEGGTLYPGLSQTFAIPAGALKLRFTIVDLNLGSSAGEPPDAFEAALLNASTMNPLLGAPAGLGNTDAALNIQNDGRTFLAPKVSISGTGTRIVEFDVTDIPEGTPVTLYFDLFGFGADDSFAILDNVSFVFAQTQSPVAVSDTATTNEDTPVLIHILANDSDADGSVDPSTVAITDSPDHGTVQVNALTGVVTYTPAQDFFGADTFRYTVRDNTGLISNEATVTITISPVNDAPVAQNDSAAKNEDTAVLINILANDTDMDGTVDATTVTITGQPTHGTLQVNALTGAVLYTPAANFFGGDAFHYTVRDNAGLISNEATVTITIATVNDAPVAQNDSASTNEDTAVLISILANDTDVDGTVDATTVTITVQPAHGALQVNAQTGAATYTPSANYFGADAFRYTVRDNAGLVSNEATVTMTIASVNDAPVAQNDSASTNEDTPVSINILANDTDVDGTVDATTVTITGQPAHGTLQVNAQTGAATYTPSANYFGADAFRYTVRDNAGLVSNEATVTMTIATVNVAPVAQNDSVTTNEDTAVLINILANDTDVDGTIDATSVTITGQPAHGTLQVNAQTGAATYAPSANYFGTDAFRYTVRDNGGAISGEAIVTITITAVNDAPIVTSNGGGDSAAVSIPENTTFVTTVTATDVDSATLTFSINGGADAARFAINGNTGVLTFISAPDFENPADVGSNNVYNVVIQVSDGSITDTQSLAVTVTDVVENHPPIANNDGYSTSEDTPLIVSVLQGVSANDSDPDGDPLTVSLVSNVSHGALSLNANGSFTYTPDANYFGSDSFTYRASDGIAFSNVATVTIGIQSVNDAPVFTSTPPSSFTIQDGGTGDGGDSVLKIPGVAGSFVEVTFVWVSRSAAYNNEFGLYKVSDAAGTVAGLSPEMNGYAQAALKNAIVLFKSGQKGGATTKVRLETGAMYAFYMIQDNTTARFLDKNPGNSLTKSPHAFFSVEDANPDDFDHLRATVVGTTLKMTWEDGTFGGDQDFNDAVIQADFATAPRFVELPTQPVPVQAFVPGASGDSVFQVPTTASGPITAAFTWETKHSSASLEFGIYQVTDASGRIGDLRPGDNGYVLAALQSGITLFAKGKGAGDIATVVLEPGAFYAFYLVQNGTAAEAVASNPGNSLKGHPLTYFSIASANRDGFDHLRGSVSNGGLRFEWEDQPNGGDRDFDDAVITLQLTAQAATSNATFTYAAQASDVDGDTITYNLTQAPSGATIDAQTGMVQWQSSTGQYAFAIQASDGHGGIATQSFTLTVIRSSQALLADGGEKVQGLGGDLMASDLAAELDVILNRLSSGGIDGEQLALLRNTTVRIADLPGALLGVVESDSIVIDTNAAGYGWFVDSSASEVVAPTEMDLLSVLAHEFGHRLGLTHEDPSAYMEERLHSGVRWIT